MREDIIYEIFLDLYKDYDALDQERRLDILAGYGLGPQALNLLQTYWECLTTIVMAGKYHDPYSKVSGGDTGWTPLPQILQHGSRRRPTGLGHGGVRGSGRTRQFCASRSKHGGYILRCQRSPWINKIWVAWVYNTLIDLFDSVDLQTNVWKTGSMICQPYCYLGGHSAEAYGQHIMGEGQTYQVHLERWVYCRECAADFAEGSLAV